MRKTVVVLLLQLLLVCPNAYGANDEASKYFDALMKRLMAKHSVPGASLAISRNGKLVYAEGFGYADKHEGTRVKATSLFRIASLSKPITAVTILKLVEKRKLKLDDKAYKFFPELQPAPGQQDNPQLFDITIRDLLRHSSGQEIYNKKGRINSPMQPPVSRNISKIFNVPHPPPFESVIRFMRSQPLLNTPGKNFKYSNYGYTLLGKIIEKVTGKTYEDYVKDEILKPSGVKCMQIGSTLREQRKPGEVTYYDVDNAKLVKSIFPNQKPDAHPYAGRHHEGWGAAGAWLASAVDIVEFVNHADGTLYPRILSDSSIRTMTERQNFPEHYKKNFWYGLGWRIQQKKYGKHWYHDGSSNIGAASILIRAANGITLSAHFNRRLPAGRKLYTEFKKAAWKGINSIKDWPTRDLFKTTSSNCRAF